MGTGIVLSSDFSSGMANYLKSGLTTKTQRTFLMIVVYYKRNDLYG